MDILRRIYAKAKKFAFKKRPFNLKMAARMVGIEDMGTLSDEEMDILGNIMGTFSPETMAQFHAGEYKVDLVPPAVKGVADSLTGIDTTDEETVLPEQETTVNDGIMQQPTEEYNPDPHGMDGLSDEDQIKKYVELKFYEEQNPDFPQDPIISKEFRDRIAADESGDLDDWVIQTVMRVAEIDHPGEAKEYVDEMMGRTASHHDRSGVETSGGYEWQEEARARKREKEKKEEGTKLKVDTTLSDLFSNQLHLMSPLNKFFQSRLGVDEDMAQKLAVKNVLTNFGSPANTMRNDRPMLFFIRHPKQIPPDTLSRLLPSLLANFGVKNIADLKAGYNAGGVKSKEVASFLRNEAGGELVNKLAELIESNNPSMNRSLMSWAKTRWQDAIRGMREKDEAGSINEIVGEGDDLSGQIVGKDRVSTQAPWTLEDRETTPQFIKQNSPVILEFAKQYLHRNMGETQALSNRLYRKMVEDEGSSNQALDRAERMYVYLNLAKRNIESFFNGMDPPIYNPRNIDEESINEKKRLTRDPTVSFANPNYQQANIHFPEGTVSDVVNHLLRRAGAGKDIKKLYDKNNRLKPDVAVQLQKYVNRSEAFTPTWHKFIRPEEMNPALNKFGQIRDAIRKGASVDYYMEDEFVKSIIPDDDVRRNILERSKRPGMRDYILHNWKYAGNLPYSKEDIARVGNKGKKRGVTEPKQQFWIDVKSMFKPLKEIRQERLEEGDGDGYGKDVFKSFFSLIPAHSDIVSGRVHKDKGSMRYRGDAGVSEHGMSYTESYHDLVGSSPEEIGDFLNLKNELRQHNYDAAAKQIEEKYKEQPHTMKDELAKLENRKAKLEDVFKFYEENRKHHAATKLFPNKMKKVKKDIGRFNRVLKKDLNNDKAVKGREASQKELAKLEKEQRAALLEADKTKRDIKVWMKEKYGPNALADPIISRYLKTLSANTSNNFKMIYAMYLRDSKKLDILFNIIDKYNTMKIASNISIIGAIIDDILCKYENILGF